jgi:ubiquinone biosynthesis protein UbiJ
MLHSLQAVQAFVAPALAEKLTLVLNHVLGSEAVATEKLRAHAGRTLHLQPQGWPALLPAPPLLTWRITPAGLLEWCGQPSHEPPATPDLSVQLDASNPVALAARMLGGETPAVQIEGDAQLAGDVNWLLQNLRWDVAADMERLFGPVVAQQLHQAGTALASGLRAAVQGAASLGDKLRPRKP